MDSYGEQIILVCATKASGRVRGVWAGPTDVGLLVEKVEVRYRWGSTVGPWQTPNAMALLCWISGPIRNGRLVRIRARGQREKDA